MSKKYYSAGRLTAGAVVVVFVFGVAALAFAAGRPDEDGAATVQAPSGDYVPAPVIAGEPLDDAIAAALAVPASWTYDPSARHVFPEGEHISYPFALDETRWTSRLDPFEYYVLREKGTEYAFSNPMHANKEPGIYYSRATGQPLFSSRDKFDSGTGWPSFSRPINPDAIVYIGDTSLFAMRIEVVDSLSGSHLGHVFPDGPAPTGQRYCINAASLIFVPDGGSPPPLIEELRQIVSSE